MIHSLHKKNVANLVTEGTASVSTPTDVPRIQALSPPTPSKLEYSSTKTDGDTAKRSLFDSPAGPGGIRTDLVSPEHRVHSTSGEEETVPGSYRTAEEGTVDGEMRMEEREVLCKDIMMKIIDRFCDGEFPEDDSSTTDFLEENAYANSQVASKLDNIGTEEFKEDAEGNGLSDDGEGVLDNFDDEMMKMEGSYEAKTNTLMHVDNLRPSTDTIYTTTSQDKSLNENEFEAPVLKSPSLKHLEEAAGPKLKISLNDIDLETPVLKSPLIKQPEEAAAPKLKMMSRHSSLKSLKSPRPGPELEVWIVMRAKSDYATKF